MFGFSRSALFVGLFALTACPAEPDSGSGGSTGPGSATTDVMAAEAFCGQYTESTACRGRQDSQGIYCDWIDITPVSIEDNACVLGEVAGACVPVTGNSTSLGCGVPPGCEGEPFQIDLDGQLGAFFQCGGSAPIGSSPCTYVEPGVFEPAECGCICDEPVGGSSSSGGGSSSSTGG